LVEVQDDFVRHAVTAVQVAVLGKAGPVLWFDVATQQDGTQPQMR